MTRAGDENGNASNKRQRTSVPAGEAPASQTTVVVDTALAIVQFNVNYDQNKYLAAGKAVHSDAFSACGHLWRISFYPNGFREISAKNVEHLRMNCAVLELLSKPSSADAIFTLLVPDKYGQPDVSVATIRTSGSQAILWHASARETDLVQRYVKDGQISFLCIVRVSHAHGSSIPVPPSDIPKHLGALLDTADGTDVSFTIDGEVFHAHRAVLAARSPVFKAELHGSMAEATMPSITLHDIAPATFKVMLRFMYTDALPGDDEVGDSPVEMFERLLAAADLYALDRLKLFFAQKLWEKVSVDTVGDMLACAEMYSCPELKQKCIGFFALEKNFKKAVLTEGFVRLVQQFPSIILELRDNAGT